MKKSLFGTSGIRGDAEKFFTNQFCFDLGRAFSIFLDNQKQSGGISIGMDPRGSSPRIRDAIVYGLLSEEKEVYDEGATSVPSINYILKVKPKIIGSIMVSGSHIKPHLNGVKFFAFKEEILKEHEKEIEDIYKKIKGEVKYRKIETDDIHDDEDAKDLYMDYLFDMANKPYPKWKVVVDTGDGAQSDTMPQILKRLELNVIEMNATIQGEFYSRDTEVEGDLKDLQEKVISEKADFGIGYDSDGDRVVFIDENGKFIPGDYTGTLIANNIKADVVVTPINTSQVIDHIDKKVVRTKVGSPYVVSKMKELNIDFGFEANGGGIFTEMLSRDGGRSTIEILNILKESNLKLSELVLKLPKFYLARDKVEYKWELKDTIIEKAKEVYKGIKIEEIDGLKIWIDKTTWILFRSSQNAPEFRVFSESNSETKAKENLSKGINLVNEVIKNG
ncbi:hypothetical protein ACFL0F_00045 [Patescibacteria group bacterium]